MKTTLTAFVATIIIALFAVPALAGSKTSTAADGKIQVRQQEKNGAYTLVAKVTLNASPEEIYAAVTNYRSWPTLYRGKISSATVKQGGPENALVELRSPDTDKVIEVKFDNLRNRIIRYRMSKLIKSLDAGEELQLQPNANGGTTLVVVNTVKVTNGWLNMFAGGKVEKWQSSWTLGAVKSLVEKFGSAA